MSNTPVVGPSTGSKESLLSYARAVNAKRLTEVQALIEELYRLGPLAGFDPYKIAVQSAHETGDAITGVGWQSPIWNTRLNPAGLGVTDSIDQQLGYKNGTDAARAMLVHHAAYVLGSLPVVIAPYKALDPRYQAVFDAGFAKSVKTWDDYGKGRWATDPDYASLIDAKAKLIATFEPKELKMPTIIDKYLDVTQDGLDGVVRYYEDRDGEKIEAIFIHIQEGTNWGSWQHFHTVKASSTVFVARNGDIWNLVREKDAPWTNGDVCAATPKGKALMAQFGPDPNMYSLTIEVEGYASSNNYYGWLAWPKPQVQLDSVVWQVKQWLEKYKLGKDRVFRHADVNQCTRPGCPGNEMYNYIISQLKDEPVVVKAAYVSPRPVVAKGVVWNGMFNVTVDGNVFHADKKKVTAGPKGAECHLWADFDTEKTRTDLEAGEDFNVLGWVVGEEIGGEVRWWITKAGSRIWVGSTNERPSTKSNVPKENPFDRLVKGVKYHAINMDGTPATFHVTAKTQSVRKFAIQDSKFTRTPLHKGDAFRAVYWVKGEKIKGNDIWLATVGDSRIWSGGTDFKLPV